MGRRNKEYSISLHQQAYRVLTQMQAFGESKKASIIEGTMEKKIFSFNTYKVYWSHVKYFIAYINEHYPECTTLRSAKKHVNEWLQSRVESGLSAWTIHTDAKAVGKLYGLGPEDKDYFKPPLRRREDITRSRGDRVRDAHFSEANNDELVKFCKGTGLRRSELCALKGKDLVTRSQIEKRIVQLEEKDPLNRTQHESTQLSMLKDARLFAETFFTYVEKGKGGRERVSPIIGDYQEQIVQRMKETKREDKVWNYVNTNADIHSYRADYATKIYKTHARSIEEIPFDRVNKGTGRRYQSDVYTCRKDEAGKKLDKKAMLVCSKALGHNRISIVADHYLRGI